MVRNIANAMKKLFWKSDIAQEEFQKSSQNLNLFLVLTQSQKLPGTSFKIVKYVWKLFVTGPSGDHFRSFSSKRFLSFSKN